MSDNDYRSGSGARSGDFPLMKVVFIGDVVGRIGCDALAAVLPQIKQEFGADCTIVNGENSAEGNGIDAKSAEMIFNAGADVITTGNHAFRKHSIEEEYERLDTLLRPANYGDYLPGKGVCEVDFGAYSVAVVNLVGTAFMNPVNNPFTCAKDLIEKLRSKIIIVDFHAEATSEKRAMGFFLAGKASAVLGTHTHVQTADEQIIDGTAYITDVGMTGPRDSILGVEKDIIIERFLTYYPKKHIYAGGDVDICGAALEIDQKSGKAIKIERFRKTFKQDLK